MREPRQAYNREDARRLAATFIRERNKAGEGLEISTRRMQRNPANILQAFLQRPSNRRYGMTLGDARNDVVILRRTCDARVSG